MSKSSKKTPPRCTGTTKGGNACTNRALPGTDPPRCAVNHGETGRPPTPPAETLQADLAELLADAVPLEAACRRVGISKSSFYSWLSQGKAAPGGPMGPFAQRMERAVADAEAELVRDIKKASETDWKAGAWLLERTLPERYARPQVRPVADPTPDVPPRQSQKDDEEAGAGASGFDELDAVTDIREAPSRRK